MRSRSSWVAGLAILAAFALSAQDRAAIGGTVTDPSGSAVSGAKLELNSDTGLRRSSTTGTTGIYQFPSLPIGTYTITINHPGFKPFVVKGIPLQYSQVQTMDAVLQVGSMSEKVEVTASSDYLNKTSAEISGVIEAPQIKELPISGRNWATLMLLAPGAINYGDGGQRAIRFSGHSLDDSTFTFDGIDTSGVQEQTQKADARLNIALDAMAEFRVTTGVYTAENGSTGGAQINVVSKTGTNAYHGSAFYAVRNDALDARSPFDGPTLPPFSLHQYGGSFGGALIKDKAFYFFNYEGLRQDLGQTFTGFVPNAAYRAKVLAKSPILKPILDAYPTGGTPADSITDRVSLVASNTVREDAGLFRFDYRFSDKTTMFFRYNIDDAYIDKPSDALGTHGVIPLIPQNIVLQLQQIISPRTINEVKFGLNRANYHNYGYGTAPLSVSIPGFDSPSGISLDTEVGTTWSYIDNLTLIRGRHTFKMGAEFRRIQLNNSGNTLTTSSISYDTSDDFINNKASSASYLQGEGVVGTRRSLYMGYFQDEFKAARNLTFNLGLRYEFYSVAHEIFDRSAVVDIKGCNGYCPKGTPYYDPNTKNFGPRVGFAWAPAMMHGKTSIRGGFGMYFGGNQNDDFSDPAESAVPRYTLTSTDFPGLSYPLIAFLDPKNQLFAPKAIDRHRKDLYYENWNLLFEHELSKDFIASVGYVAGAGHHLFTKYTINLIDPLTGKRPLPTFSSFGLKTNDGNNNFNALQASIQRRFVRGFLFQANYMWSHGITDSSIGSGEAVAFQNQACRACDRSNSNIDVRHTLTLNGVYELPFGKGKPFLSGDGVAPAILGGWQVSGIGTARSGLPVNITVTRKANTLIDQNTSGQRPDVVPGVSIYAADPSVNGWFNADAFRLPANNVWGNLGRYAAVGPTNFETDVALQRRFRITEKVHMSLRAAAFNIANHPQYKNPASALGAITMVPPIKPSASFGKITGILNTGAVGTGAPRRIEFMFRMEF